MVFNVSGFKDSETPKSDIPEKKADTPDKVNLGFAKIAEKFNDLFKDDLLNEYENEQDGRENSSSETNENYDECQNGQEQSEKKDYDMKSMLDELFSDDSDDTSDETGESGIEKKDPILEKIEKTLGTPEGIKELIGKHSEKAELWEEELSALDTLNDPEATPTEIRSAQSKLSVLKSQLMETAVKDSLTDAGFDVETKQRVVEGESGDTRPDVIAKNNTDKPIEVFGETIQPGETISVECKCGGTKYMTDELNNHIPNQLSGQIGTKVLLTTSDINDVTQGLAKDVCEIYGTKLAVPNISVADVEAAIKEVASE